MNRIARRSVTLLVLAAILLAGMVFFVVDYFINGGKWAVHQGSPHVYNGTNIDCGVVTDRDGQLLLNMNGGRAYSETLKLRKATSHWLGDRYGYISAPALPHYSKELAGYNPITGLYSYSGDGQAKLTLSAKLQQTALDAMGDHKGTVAIYNYKISIYKEINKRYNNTIKFNIKIRYKQFINNIII